MDAALHRDSGEIFRTNTPDIVKDTTAAISVSNYDIGPNSIISNVPPSITDFQNIRENTVVESEYESGFYEKAGKRIFDICAAGFILFMASPVILVLLLMARRDGGPAIFRHHRIGRGGDRFHCLKVRSMVIDAEQRLAAILHQDPAAAEEWRETHKLTHDPRVTWFGRFIRKTSLDELPQLWNVIRGEMSLVGPRPIVSEEIARYGTDFDSYTRVRPGITGLWQVSGRNDTTYDERVAMDVDYARSVSFLQDLKILLLTARSVALRTGR
ncbi:sugar transferase [Sinirhodobacter populi]|uniref:Sugar transferase n=1 Tax=Paenirhodobacter populi TaxID=2306993 RepID=A0A443KLV6_9RHOB|nr:sugar transferase [Sinirhodobacter populi]RWR33776.1 sugar transferase [Sinirhodobacter populi]